VDELGNELEKRSSVSLHWRNGTKFGYRMLAYLIVQSIGTWYHSYLRRGT